MIKMNFTLLLFASCLTGISQSHAQTVVSDDLVSNLACQGLSQEKILSAIDPQKAFSPDRHIPLKNWSFSVGLYEIANCWSLSHSQRMMFYLGRSYLDQTPDALKNSLNMIRGTTSTYDVIPWNSEWFRKLQTGIKDRNFKSDVEAYQDRRFHNIDNATYLNGSRERSIKENAQSFQVLLRNINQKKLTEVLLRPALRAQHVVVAKYSITRPTGEVDFFVYDSNFPEKEMTVTYSPKTQHFYAPEIVQHFQLPRPQDPIGVFLVDEKDRDGILASLLKHYTQTCEALNWAKN